MRYGYLCIWLFLMALTGSAVASPSASQEVEGLHGELHVSGMLTEGACRLEMASSHQQIELDNTPLHDLTQPGDRGRPLTFILRLRDCVRRGDSLRDARTGSLVQDYIQPVISIRFDAPADADNPQLIKATGVTGIGLRITDVHHRDIRLGDSGAPLFVMPGGDELAYQVQTERTAAPLMAGALRAVIHFSLDYN